ncbi:MAG TPA: glycosyltransferase [Candidatus Acidoferrum sp.]|nr:glycosyltransferase [Candidatus Acidoferrum sp.]
MEILIIHPNFPGQFRNLAASLVRMPGMKVFGLGDAEWTSDIPQVEGVKLLTYPAPAKPENKDALHPYVRRYDEFVRRGVQAINTLSAYKVDLYLEPDVIIVHPGFGDGLFLKDLFPATRIIGLFEFYYSRYGADVGFDPEFPANLNDIFRVRALNAAQLMALDCCDIGISPTQWQRSRFPEVWQQKLQVLHEGIDTKRVAPNPAASVQLKDGTVLRAGDEVLTYVGRCLEPYRGYHIFMRALPAILAARPNCHVVIVGADKLGYGTSPPKGTTFREHYLAEVQGRLDMSRVHYAGALVYDDFIRVLQISRVHAYLTSPFVLSWSMMEAMSAGCLVLGSATPPVEELIRDGENGLLFPFHSPQALADRAIDALANPQRYQRLRSAARQTIIDHYDFETKTLPAYLRLLHP